MWRISVVFSILFAVAVSPAAAREQKVPKEENCSQAISMALEQLRRTPPDLKERDDADRRKLLDDMERLVDENRRGGASECQIWILMLGKAFNQ
jgi:Tfp pilus assembly protein PilF